MKRTEPSIPLHKLLQSLGNCFTDESAHRILALKADRKTQRTVDRLAEKKRESCITPEEDQEYSQYVTYGTFVAILKSMARQHLSRANSR
jgi:hypothetical protein